MPNSQNGWPVANRDQQDRSPVHGVTVPNGVLAGDVATVLHHLMDRVHREVEELVPGWCWGWHVKTIEGSSTISNHASGTAVDLNAPRHPVGVRGTFTPAQRTTIRRILADLDGVVRWGGDYIGRADDMHFEINKDAAAVKRVADRIREDDTVSKQDVIDALRSDEGREALAEGLAHRIKTTPALREALAWAILAYDPGADADGDTPNGAVVNMTNPTPSNPTVGPATALERAQVAAVVGYQIRDRVDALTALVRSLAELAATEAGEDDAEMVELRARLDAALAAVKAVPGLTVGALGGAGQSDAEVAAALRAALGDRARPVGQLLAA